MQPADEILIERSKNGDMDAFEQLVHRYENKVYTVAYRFIGNHADASDLAQDTFLRLYHALPSFRGESSFMTWLYRITANVCRDEIRRRQKYHFVSLDNETENNGDHIMSRVSGRTPSPEEVVEQKEFNGMIQECIDSLNKEHRLILIMREVQGFSYEEIADILKCSLGTVKSRLSRARQAFKEKFNDRREL
ncbi:sigma-70 family RNA polymerase sigma factor [Pelotomaculum terephthalicicum JT]|uniref:RNA polymerase sigma factor n=1 Tax=Pelotomaculum TaxID=191373 RepID=UPI0009D3F4D6|nr:MULTISPECIES: sigma-70 family RNA polymerase sigma factor [Pelotomaculum]MCG9968028.1 sigma-70 family RNA polymerase sigma factor [Pelotomaculum terephthalicicum JT]OPX87526.1 MAG: ECF RNA polymerase sigma-E factor [Pelotomaculum sp. PtaB.Bin117]OPY60638.1 MAG: ECF RNA polymerase sigma-E factor [Pelotomaculum sp. PtaU1.Bin065]